MFLINQEYGIYEHTYRVTHHVVQNLLLTSKQKFGFGLAWPGLAKAELDVLKSTGGFGQCDVSPCIIRRFSLRDPYKEHKSVTLTD